MIMETQSEPTTIETLMQASKDHMANASDIRHRLSEASK